MAEKYAISIDIGGTNIRAALIDRDGHVETRLKKPTGNNLLPVIHNLLDSLYSSQSKHICGIGVAVAGIIDRDNGIVMKSPNIPELTTVNLKADMKKRYKTCVVVENDANAAAYGENISGAGKNYKNFVVFTLGTGIGGGVVINNKLLPIAAEIGHMSININGQPCACGNAGCLESYASGTAIISSAISQIEKGAESILKNFYNGNFYKLNAEDVYNAAMDGDSLSRMILKDAGKSLGTAIANIINIFSPEAVVLTGGVAKAWNIYVDSAIKEASKRALKELFKGVDIIRSPLGDDAGIIGAAMLAFDECEIKLGGICLKT